MDYEKLLLSKRKITTDGHWLWTGFCRDSGHGGVHAYNTTMSVHKLAAKLWHPDFDNNAVYCHKDDICGYKNCFNPDHIYRGTRQTNMTDRSKKQKCCYKGHEYTEENTYRYRSGKRQCKICRLESLHKSRKLKNIVKALKQLSVKC